MFELSKPLKLDLEAIESSNLTSRFGDDDLQRLGAHVWEGYERDRYSRMKWLRRNEAGMDLALQVAKAKNFPWPNCSNVAFPLVTIAAMQFHARSYPAIIQGTDIVKMRVNGNDADGRLRERADRISAHMSWQCYEEDAGWEEQHDRGLLNLSIVGCNFIKSYFDGDKAHNVSELVLAKDLVIDYWAKCVEDAARKTQIIRLFRNDIYTEVKKGIFRDVLGEAWYNQAPARSDDDVKQREADRRQGLTPPDSDEQTPWRGLEQHILLDLDQDGYAEPYIITIEEGSKAVLRIVCGFDREEDIERSADGSVISIRRMQYFTKYSFIPSPDGGIYDIGFGVLLGPLNESVNTAINQLFDAGTMQTTAGGFLGRGAKIRGGTYSFQPFGWIRVDSQGDDLRKNIVPYDVREPSAVLFNLLGLLIDYVNRISGATDMMVGENPGQNTPAETSRAMLQQGMAIYNAIFKRVWRCMKEEFKKLYVLNGMNLAGKIYYGAEGASVSREDYLGDPNLIAPAADPNLATKQERFGQAQALKASAIQTPGYNVDEVERTYLRALGFSPEEISVLYPGVEKLPPGKSEKVQIAEMQLQQKQQEFQGKMQIEAAQLQLDAREAELKAQELQVQIQLKMVELQGDVEDREVQRMNAMVSMLKSQADQARARADVLIAQLESMGASAEQLKVAREQDREDVRMKADFTLKALGLKQNERKLDQKDEEIEIKRKQAAKPKAAA